ncbi:hypothetical protein PHMEG_00012317 [Phytophthora megakarya]|uniref:WRKY19-like zinc finger domain-containing protein n=1 Tax=Phytophthora megakarya TaxID=4795 RepID=A0A225WB58_9STRA|nr:hypothetical protein PHMEG_00012317 [Phytophthora megakarya]
MVARTRNLCRAHGGGAPHCQVEGCEKVAEPGGSCWAHGGGKRCKVEGCMKRRVSKGLCSDHGTTSLGPVSLRGCSEATRATPLEEMLILLSNVPIRGSRFVCRIHEKPTT